MKKKMICLMLIWVIVCCSGCVRRTSKPVEIDSKEQHTATKSERSTEPPAEAPTQAPTEAPTAIPLEGLSTECNGWGFRRLLSSRPEFTSEQEKDMASFHGIYMGEKDSPRLYLTFDEGYENGYTPQILDVLKKTDTPATFFITGSYLEREPELVGRMVEEGHIVGNHSLNHPSMPSLPNDAEVEREIGGLDQRFFEQFGIHMHYFRPPMGEYSQRTLALTANMGYSSVFWSLAYHDWDPDLQKGTDYAYDQIMSNLHNGCVLLLHAVSVDNANVLERVITDARKEGYEFCSLDEYR